MSEIRNNEIREKLGLTSKEDKMKETRIISLVHIQRRDIDMPM